MSEIYRFRTVDKLFEYDELMKQTIFFAEPGSLNDGYEGVFNLTALNMASEWVAIFDSLSLFLKEKNKKIPYSTDGLREIASKLEKLCRGKEVGENSIFYVLNNIMNGRGKAAVGLPLRENSTANTIMIRGRVKANAISPTETEEFIQKIKGNIHPRWASASFTTLDGIKNAANWGAYCGAGKGIVLIFNRRSMYEYGDSSCRFSKSGGLLLKGKHPKYPEKDSAEALAFYDVSYTDKTVEVDWRLGQDPYVDGKSIREIRHLQQELWRDFFIAKTSKQNSWQHEKEVRLIIEASAYAGFNEPQGRALIYNFNDLEGVIFGPHMARENKLKVMDIIKNKCIENNRSHFNFKQAFFNYMTSEMDIVDLEDAGRY